MDKVKTRQDLDAPAAKKQKNYDGIARSATSSSPTHDINETCTSLQNATLNAIAEHFDNLPLMETIGGQHSFQRDLLMKLDGKPLFDDAFKNCKTMLVDFPNMFQDFKPSDTMQKTLSKPDLIRAISLYGGPVVLLQQIVSEMKIRTTFIAAGKTKNEEICYFLRFKFPFNLKYNIPNRAVVHGVGTTIYTAKDNVATEGLKLLKSLYF